LANRGGRPIGRCLFGVWYAGERSLVAAVVVALVLIAMAGRRRRDGCDRWRGAGGLSIEHAAGPAM
jgi:hypothetical protein